MENAVEVIADEVPSPATNLIQVIERAALNPDIDIDKMERLLQMQERIVEKQAETDFTNAMAEAQSEMVRVTADATNPQTKSKYATYGNLDRALRPVYTKHGFSLSFDTGEGAPGDFVRVICHVGHKLGYTRTYKVDMPADGKGAKGGDVMTKTHAMGSAFTYGQRYLLKLIFNVAIGEDDDGNAAGKVLIDDKQKEHIVNLLAELGVEATAPFLKYMGVESVDQITQANYGKAIHSLNVKITKTKDIGDG